MGALQLLLSTLKLNPTTAEFELLVKIIQHISEALNIVKYQIGANTYPIATVTVGFPAHVTLTNLLNPYLNAHGNVTDDQGVTYGLESERHLFGSKNDASVNQVDIPEGLVLHLLDAAPDIGTNLNALVTIGYIFPATARTPVITLISEVEIGILKEATVTTTSAAI